MTKMEIGWKEGRNKAETRVQFHSKKGRSCDEDGTRMDLLQTITFAQSGSEFVNCLIGQTYQRCDSASSELGKVQAFSTKITPKGFGEQKNSQSIRFY